MNNDSINEKIAKGDFEIFVETGVTNKKQKFLSLDSLIIQSRQYKNKLDKLTPPRLGKLLPIVIINGELSIGLGMVLSDQGSLQDAVNDIEESARLEIIQKFNEAEKGSIASIKEGNRIAKDMLKSNISREQLGERLAAVNDMQEVRNVIDLARQTKTIVDFKHSSQIIGGSLDISKVVFANDNISLCNCKVIAIVENGEFEVETTDYIKIYERQDARKNLLRLTCDSSSPLNFLLHLSKSVSARFDCKVRVAEDVKSGKLKLIVTNLPDPMQILSTVESNLSKLKIELQLGFDFNHQD